MLTRPFLARPCDLDGVGGAADGREDVGVGNEVRGDESLDHAAVGIEPGRPEELDRSLSMGKKKKKRGKHTQNQLFSSIFVL